MFARADVTILRAQKAFIKHTLTHAHCAASVVHFNDAMRTCAKHAGHFTFFTEPPLPVCLANELCAFFFAPDQVITALKTDHMALWVSSESHNTGKQKINNSLCKT